MGNSLPCLSHEAKIPPKLSNKSRRGLHFFLSVPLSWFHKTKKPTQTGSTRELSRSLPLTEKHTRSEKKGVIRVKVVLTKEEAAQLLAMCAQGEERKLADAVRRLGRLPAYRHGSSTGRWRPALASIPEEDMICC